MIISHSQLPEITNQSFDILILGGGINGAAIQLEANARGYSTLLVEKHDFAFGATSHSSRLIHGGLRYLEHGEIDLVYESLSARNYLLHKFSHLVKPLKLHIPFFPHTKRFPLTIRFGLWLYDFISFDSTLKKASWVDVPLFSAKLIQPINGLVKKMIAYFDASIAWPERLVFQLLNYPKANAFSINYTHAKLLDNGNVGLESLITHEKFEFRPKLIVNATGAWVDETNGWLKTASHFMGGTKGSHIVINQKLVPDNIGFYVEAKSDGRPFFILPWMDFTLIGTTDIHYSGNLDHIQVSTEEINYLKSELSIIFPELSEYEVIYTFSALRPLPSVKSGTQPGKITRKHTFSIHHSEIPILSVIGGKLTTFPTLSGDLLKQIDTIMKKKTHKNSFFLNKKGLYKDNDTLILTYKAIFATHQSLLSDEEAIKLIERYGDNLSNFLLRQESDSADFFNKIHPTLSYWPIEFIFLSQHEGWVTWADLFERRTGISVYLSGHPHLWLELVSTFKKFSLLVDKLGVPIEEYPQFLQKGRNLSTHLF